MRILIVEPDAAVAESIRLMLVSESFNVTVTDSGRDAIDQGKIYDYDLICLELNLLDLSGYDVIKQLRLAKVRTSILVCSGLAGIQDIVKALGTGADDYMTKPFHKDELVARIHAIVRRSKGHAVSVIETGPLSLNLSTKTVTLAGSPVHLTRMEYGMLELMILRKGVAITKESFMSHLYGGRDEPEIKIIDVFICKLRRKLKAAGAADAIETVWGRGYLLRECRADSPSPSLAPEVRDLIDDPPTGFVSKKSFMDKRREDIAAGHLKSPRPVAVA
jgi:two-component system cell cycle response regulator CtrA